MFSSEWIVPLVFVAGAIAVYYSVVDERVASLWRPLYKVLPITGHSYLQAGSTIRMVLAGSFQLLFLILLAAILRVEVWRPLVSPFDPILILYGIVLGFGEMALASFLCKLTISAAMSLAPRHCPAEPAEWSAIANAGWMRHYRSTLESTPLWVSLSLIVLYVSAEELVFRGVLLQYFLPLGALGALAISAGLFVLVQVFQMPSWQSAMFPVVGALVMGVLHGALFLAVPCLVPLIVAHCMFFFLAVL